MEKPTPTPTPPSLPGARTSGQLPKGEGDAKTCRRNVMMLMMRKALSIREPGPSQPARKKNLGLVSDTSEVWIRWQRCVSR